MKAPNLTSINEDQIVTQVVLDINATPLYDEIGSDGGGEVPCKSKVLSQKPFFLIAILADKI